MLDVGIILLPSQLSSELFRRMKLPGLLGAIFAGVLIGPNVFGVVSNTQIVNTIALFGALLVLFVIGLEFPAESFFRIGKVALLAAIALISRAEMSLIIAKGGVDQGHASPDLIAVAAIVVVVSIGIAASALKWALPSIEASEEVGRNIAREQR